MPQNSYKQKGKPKGKQVNKCDVDRLLINFNFAGVTSKGYLSLHMYLEWIYQESLERLGCSLSYDYSWNPKGRAVWNIWLEEINCFLLDPDQTVLEY